MNRDHGQPIGKHLADFFPRLGDALLRRKSFDGQAGTQMGQLRFSVAAARRRGITGLDKRGDGIFLENPAEGIVGPQKVKKTICDAGRKCNTFYRFPRHFFRHVIPLLQTFAVRYGLHRLAPGGDRGFPTPVEEVDDYTFARGKV